MDTAAVPSYKGYRYPAGGDRAHGLAVPPLPLVISGGGGAGATSADHRVVRDDPAVVCHIRPPVRRRPAATSTTARDKWHLDEDFIKINGVHSGTSGGPLTLTGPS